MKYFPLLFLIIFFQAGRSAAQSAAYDTVFVASWNLENLFDTVHDEGKSDEEFLPGSAKRWNSERMDRKLENLARVISSMNGGRGPDILGVCEVEHESLLKNMISKYLKFRNYRTAEIESPDERGIDNGIIYDGDEFTEAGLTADTVHLSDGNPTRLILNINLVTKTGDTIIVFMNHWPSRSSGKEDTETYRIEAGLRLRKAVNRYLSYNDEAKMIIMGDFNDEPSDNSIILALEAKPHYCGSSGKTPVFRKEYDLEDLAYPLYEKGEGTYKYRDDWNMLDQIIVSREILNGEDFKYICGSFEVYKPEFMVTKSGRYKGSPLPTFGGNRYLGGYSDHFPVTAKFLMKRN